MAEGFDAVAAVRAVARFGLPGAAGPGGLEVPEGRWEEFLRLVVAERVTGLAVAAAEEGALALAEPQAQDLLAAHRDAMAWCLRLEGRLLELAEALGAAGVAFVVLKGPALAHAAYPDPSWRSFGDLDLLVGTGDWRRALAVLADLGCRRRLPEPRPGFDERFGKAATHRTPEGEEIDLHRTLVLGPFGLWIRPEELLERTEAFELGGVRLRRLDGAGLLLNACVHAALGQRKPFLQMLRDVAQVAVAADVDWGAVGRWAREWRLGPVLRLAFAQASEALGVPWPVAAREALGREPSRREARLLEAHTGTRRYRGGPALATLHAIPGLRAKAAYVRGLLLPDRRFVAARSGDGGRGRYLRRWAVPLRWAAGALGRDGQGGPRPGAVDGAGRRGVVGVVGLGVVGGAVARAFADVGVRVAGYDPYLGVGEPAELAPCEVVFVCVPTPGREDGALDDSAVWDAVRTVAPHLAPGTVVAVKSTVAPGTTEALARAFPGLELAHVPEFLVARAPVETFTRPDRVVIGARSARARERLAALLRRVAPEAPIVELEPTEAELAKLCSNAMLAAKVTLANELALVCERYGVGWDRVRGAVGMDRRIGPHHLEVRPERGFGGSCLPKDVDGLIAAAGARGYGAPVLRAIVAFNRWVRGAVGAAPGPEGGGPVPGDGRAAGAVEVVREGRVP